MKEEYTIPEMELIYLRGEDVITSSTSNELPLDPIND